MYKYILESAGDINWMAIFALITFVFVFVLGSYLALIKDDGEIQRAANLPLADDDTAEL